MRLGAEVGVAVGVVKVGAIGRPLGRRVTGEPVGSRVGTLPAIGTGFSCTASEYRRKKPVQPNATTKRNTNLLLVVKYMTYKVFSILAVSSRRQGIVNRTCEQLVTFLFFGDQSSCK